MKKLILIIVVIALIVVGGALFWTAKMSGGFSARAQPSFLEIMAARTARKLAMPADVGNRKNPFPVTPENLSEARAHFADHCAVCHANNGSGATQIGRNLYPKAPDMRLPTTQHLSDGQIYYIIHNGIRLTGMPAWGTDEKDDDSWKLVLFIRHLPQLTANEEQQMEQLNPKGPEERQEEQEEQQFLNQGQPESKAPKPATHHNH